MLTDTGAVGKFVVIRCHVEFHNQISPAPVDNILCLIPVKMHRCLLFFISHHYLLTVELVFFVPVSVAYCEERKPLSFEIPAAEICNIPA